MSRAEKIILALTLAVLALVVVLEQLAPKDPDWTPTYGSGAIFTIVDLLHAAGVVATIP